METVLVSFVKYSVWVITEIALGIANCRFIWVQSWDFGFDWLDSLQKTGLHTDQFKKAGLSYPIWDHLLFMIRGFRNLPVRLAKIHYLSTPAQF